MCSGHVIGKVLAKHCSDPVDSLNRFPAYTEWRSSESSMVLSILSQPLKVVLPALLLVLMIGVSGVATAEEDLGKSLFLVYESDRVVAVNAETGQFFDLVLSAKERIRDRLVANRVAIL